MGGVLSAQAGQRQGANGHGMFNLGKCLLGKRYLGEWKYMIMILSILFSEYLSNLQ